MKKIASLLAILVALLFTSFTVIKSTNWKIADGFSIKFSGKNASGVFESLKGDIQFDEANLEISRFDITVDVSSINTGIGLKNKHSRSDSFFDAEKYPTIKFTSGKTIKTVKGYEVTGNLDMHGVQKQITIPFTFNNNTFSGSFTVNRLDYKVGTDTGMSYIVGTDIKIEISVPVIK